MGVFEVEINIDGTKKTVIVKEPRSKHQEKWFELIDKSQESREFFTYRDELMRELCSDFDTKEKLGELEVVEKEKILKAIEGRFMLVKQTLTENFSVTSKQQPN